MESGDYIHFMHTLHLFYLYYCSLSNFDYVFVVVVAAVVVVAVIVVVAVVVVVANPTPISFASINFVLEIQNWLL